MQVQPLTLPNTDESDTLTSTRSDSSTEVRDSTRPGKRGQSELHFVTEDGEQCFMWRSSQLTYIGHDRKELPHVLAIKFGPSATKLDLSYNSLTSFRNIDLFTNLSELVLDNNCFTDDKLDFKQNLRLKTLSMNKNELTDLSKLISTIEVCFPNLEFLSLIGNPLCPTLASNCAGGQPIKSNSVDQQLTIIEYDVNANNMVDLSADPEFVHRKYRHFIIYHLPNLKFLDSRPVTSIERDEALRRCFWMDLDAPNYNNVRHQPDTLQNQIKSLSELQLERPTMSTDQTDSQLTIMSDYDNQNIDYSQFRHDSSQMMQLTPLENNSAQTKGNFMRLSYKYTGKHSEGNRFIRNQDL